MNHEKESEIIKKAEEAVDNYHRDPSYREPPPPYFSNTFPTAPPHSAFDNSYPEQRYGGYARA